MTSGKVGAWHLGMSLAEDPRSELSRDNVGAGAVVDYIAGNHHRFPSNRIGTGYNYLFGRQCCRNIFSSFCM